MTVKLLFNSVVSTPVAEFMTIDIKKIYLNTLLARYEYLRRKLTNLLEDVRKKIGLKDKETSYSFVHFKIRKVMYGLPQDKFLAQDLLEQRFP